MVKHRFNLRSFSSGGTLMLGLGGACSEEVLTLRMPDSVDNVLVLDSDPTTAMVVVAFDPNENVSFDWSCPEACLRDISVFQGGDAWSSTADLPLDEQLDGIEVTCRVSARNVEDLVVTWMLEFSAR